MSISLRTRFAGTITLFMIVLTILLSFVIGQRSTQEVRSEIGNSLAEMAFQMADKLDQYMWSRYGEIEIMTELEALKEPKDFMVIENLLNRLQISFPSFSWIGYINPEGVVKAATGGILREHDISSRPVYIEGMKGHFIGDVHDAVLLSNLLPNPTGEPMKFVDISIPILNSEGQLSGILAAHLSWEWAKEVEISLLEPLRNRKGIELFIVSANDNTILLGPNELIGQTLNLNSINNAGLGKNSWDLEDWGNGKKYLTGYVKANGYMNYPGLDWVVLVRQPIEEAYLTIANLKKFILRLGLVISTLFAIIGWITANKVVKPLQEIAMAADRLKVGEKVAIPKHKGIKEIEILESSLSQLIGSLIHTESALGEMENLAQHDALTGLPNRIALDFHIEEAKKKATRSGLTLTFLYLDLDGFKQVNDLLGHNVGDILLQRVAIILKENVRDDEIVVRLGGDEFLMVLYTSLNKSRENGTVVADRVISALNKPFDINGNIAKIGCSIGGAVWPSDGIDTIEIVRLADEALYISKRTGKNKTTFHQDYDSSLKEEYSV
ncbi:sensor domain-containing diguanylate cyclase [Serpentinicella alkaliphila]|nr:sensor domain-containing diguanylate cyclase [Serpentinicella alkaliphila]QUH27264.1 GGDEF domain-containing protein [Serpentinicella alkaliphila]